MCRGLRLGGLALDSVGRERETMELTRDFRETVRARAQRDPAFRRALLQEGVECLLGGDVETGKVVLRAYFEATKWAATTESARRST